MRTLAERLRATREEKVPKMSQTDLGKLAGLSQSTIAHIESGRNRGSGYILALAAALQVRPQWLQSESGPKFDDEGDSEPTGATKSETGMPTPLKRICSVYKGAGPAKQEALRLLAELPEHEMAPLVLVMQSIGAKYKR